MVLAPRYPAGLELRFARVVMHRPDRAPDKVPDEADPIELVEAMYRGHVSVVSIGPPDGW